ncbi:MAG: TIGR04283 family arsenosugar biosynthesis glycosyltransferase [Alphaproteobacteria bacterium]|nr:TIGR04283 family arsenosugar biosynthesis glycosyltransferase [Alphaproteobacteria bacterium]
MKGNVPDLSIIIPTLNAERRIAATIDSLEEARESMPTEIVVVDGGSDDDTVARATAAGAITVTAPRGRGSQLSAGAKEATGRWLLFLHADTTLEPFWSTTVSSFMRNKGNVLRAAHFTFALDDASSAARRVEVLANWRARRLGLPYGDQGLLMSRTMYESLVGYLDIPIMEDVDIVRRIGKQKLFELPATATTSAERYKRDGYVLRSLRNLTLLSLYFAGVPPQRLARLYG